MGVTQSLVAGFQSVGGIVQQFGRRRTENSDNPQAGARCGSGVKIKKKGKENKQKRMKQESKDKAMTVKLPLHLLSCRARRVNKESWVPALAGHSGPRDKKHMVLHFNGGR